MAELGAIPQAMERRTSLSLEWKAVLACLRAALVDWNAGGIDQDLLSPPLAWPRVADMAREHRVAPLLFRSLQRLAPTPEANAAVRLLKQLYLATAARNAVLYQGLESILVALSAGGTRAIVLKGAALADTVYPERALRPMNDIDLLVREEDLERAEAQLRGAGYEMAHDPETRVKLRRGHHHWVFRNTRPVLSGIPVELHWHLHPPGSPFPVDLGALWERAVSSRIAGVTALTLSPEDLLLHLCAHAARHRFNGLMSLCDIAAVIAFHDGRIDWPALDDRAAASGSSPYAAIALQLAAELLGASVPASTLNALRKAGGDGPLLDLARERILEEKGALREAAELLLKWRRRAAGGGVSSLKRALTPSTMARPGSAGPGIMNRVSSYPAHILSLLRRYLPLIRSLVRHPRAVEAIARREANKSPLDSWCRTGIEESGASP